MKQHHEFKLNEEYEYQSVKHENSMIKETFKVCREIPFRNRYKILASLMEEVGELSTEVAVQQGDSYKPAGEDGIIGEAVDVIICALDMIFMDAKVDITDEDLEDVIMRILKRKLEKWKQKSKQP